MRKALYRTKSTFGFINTSAVVQRLTPKRETHSKTNLGAKTHVPREEYDEICLIYWFICSANLVDLTRHAIGCVTYCDRGKPYVINKSRATKDSLNCVLGKQCMNRLRRHNESEKKLLQSVFP